VYIISDQTTQDFIGITYEMNQLKLNCRNTMHIDDRSRTSGVLTCREMC